MCGVCNLHTKVERWRPDECCRSCLCVCVCTDSLSVRGEQQTSRQKVAWMKQSYVKQNICSVSSASVCLCNTQPALLHSPPQSSGTRGAEIQHGFIHRISPLESNLWNFLTLSPTLRHFGCVLNNVLLNTSGIMNGYEARVKQFIICCVVRLSYLTKHCLIKFYATGDKNRVQTATATINHWKNNNIFIAQ